MISKQKVNGDYVDQPPVQIKTKKGKRWIKISICLIVISNIIAAAFLLGFIPVGLNVMTPIGNYETLNADVYLEEFPELSNMPNLEKLEYAAFGTDASKEDVVSDYDTKLKGQGYSQEYSGTVEVDGVYFEVAGFLKGLTAVAVLVADRATNDHNFDSLVLYATGNALDFREILDWYQSN